MGIFNKSNQPPVNIDRNTFDGSFASSGTFRFGALYPVLCKEVLPGDTFQIDTAFGLRFMPLAFPIQTKIRADIHYFYVRNRNLWKDWPNFIGQTGSPSILPHLSSRSKKANMKTGSLGDYLGLPSTVVGVSSSSASAYTSTLFYGAESNKQPNYTNLYIDYDSLHSPGVSVPLNTEGSYKNLYRGTGDSGLPNGFNTYFANTQTIATSFVYNDAVPTYFVLKTNIKDSDNPNIASLSAIITLQSSTAAVHFSTLSLPFTSSRGEQYVDSDGFVCYRWLLNKSVSNTRAMVFFVFDDANNSGSGASLSSQSGTELTSVKNASVDQTEFTYSWFTQTGTSIPLDVDFEINTDISALPFRAYESIYNSFYRDQRNNPYVVNGVTDPNVYIPTTDGGVDDNDYSLRYRNWEQDFLTSAVPSPQQGIAPLVGITSTGVATFMDEGNPVSVQLDTAEDGNRVVSAQMDSSTPESVRRSVVNLASAGISINDFRGVNALQRWLETNMRRGLKYKDQLMSHFGVDASYSLLDMPEFLGGTSQYVNIDQINNMTDNGNPQTPLGGYAGQASLVGSSNHRVSNYFDEHGYIIAILSIVPVPTYSQLLPKHFTKSDPLDYFFPEFGHLGYQPIPYREVCPLQAQAYGVSLNSTFGYQRAWYDYLANVDEVHGGFRKDLQQFILARVFNGVPSLNEKFLLVDPTQLNEVFTVTELGGEPVDPILGQIYFDIKMKRKIPRYGIPRLE